MKILAFLGVVLAAAAFVLAGAGIDGDNAELARMIDARQLGAHVHLVSSS